MLYLPSSSWDSRQVGLQKKVKNTIETNYIRQSLLNHLPTMRQHKLVHILPLGQVGSPLNVEEEQGCIYAARSIIVLDVESHAELIL